MPTRVSAWAIYDVFETTDDSQIFVGVVTDSQWRLFCEAFGLTDLLADETLATNPNASPHASASCPGCARCSRA